MSPREAEQAVAHVDGVMAGVINRRQAEALAFSSERDTWFASTQQFVSAANAQTEMDKKNYEISVQRLKENNDEAQRRQRTTSFNPAPTGGAKK
jgi:hypothetical protein